MSQEWKVKFWGVRGSFPKYDPNFIKTGGHTSCVSVETPEAFIIFDAGTGLLDCGRWLISQRPDIRKVYLFLSHAHLDHLCGLPSFEALWHKDFHLLIYAGSLQPFGGIQTVIEGLFKPPYFPVSWSQVVTQTQCMDLDLGATLHLTESLSIQTISLNHPNGGCGYRLQEKEKSVVYPTDTSHTPNNENFKDFAQKTNLLIYDATFTEEEFERHPDWGHSTWKEGVKLANAASVQKLALFHHEPFHDDLMLDEIEKQAKAQFPGSFLAKQGFELIVK